MGRYALPVLGRLLLKNNGRFADAAEAGRALYWYVHAAVRGRFAGSTETFLAKDLETVDRDGIDGVIHSLRRARNGSLTIDAQDFEGAGRGSRSYPLLYLVARTGGARDLVTGRPLGTDTAAVEVCEIFPRTLLAEGGLLARRDQRGGQLRVRHPLVVGGASPRDPTQLPGGRGSRRSGLAVDPGRRLAGGELPASSSPPDGSSWPPRPTRSSTACSCAACRGGWRRSRSSPRTSSGYDVRVAQVDALVEEVIRMGLACPTLDAEVPDPETGAVLAVAQAFWADGLQAGQGAPVVLELDPDEADLPRFAELGYEVFVSVDALRGYVQRRSEMASGDRDASGGERRGVPAERARRHFQAASA